MLDDQATETSALIKKLKASWTEKGIDLRPGVSLWEIETFESRYQVRLPHDSRAFYSTIDGIKEWETDPDHFSFFQLSKVKNVTEELAHFGGIPDYREIVLSLEESQRWYVIVDFLITSAVYAIRLSATDDPTPILWIGDGQNHRIVASSFSAVLEAYLANPHDLL